MSNEDQSAIGPVMITREKMLEDALRAVEAERDFLRGIVHALVEQLARIA